VASFTMKQASLFSSSVQGGGKRRVGNDAAASEAAQRKKPRRERVAEASTRGTFKPRGMNATTHPEAGENYLAMKSKMR